MEVAANEWEWMRVSGSGLECLLVWFTITIRKLIKYVTHIDR